MLGGIVPKGDIRLVAVWATWWLRGTAALMLVGSAIAGYRLRMRSIGARSCVLEAQI